MNESVEMYLETILVLQRANSAVRSIDIAKKMGFARPTVSVAVKKLKENGQISIDGKGTITLTEQGKQKAESVYERHEVIGQMLISAGVDAQTAYADSCRIEHVISETSFSCIKKHYYKKKQI